MKKVISVILVIAAIFTALLTPAQAAQPTEISPQYVTCQSVGTYLTIDSAGNVKVSIVLNGYTNITEVSVTTYLERENESIWYRVLLNPWTYSGSASSFTKVFTGQISTSGNYRARSTFTITGSTVETITVTDECTY